MNIQISMFEMLDQYETPEIPINEQRRGTKGWIIELTGLFLRENGFKEDWRGVATRPMVFKENTHKDRDGYLWQCGETTKGPFTGWCGSVRKVFRSRPTWNDCVKFAKENGRRDDPKDIRYFDRTGDWTEIRSYEEGA